MVSIISTITILRPSMAKNKHAHANLRRILGLEIVARVFWGLTQPRTAQGGHKTAPLGWRSKDAHRTILARKSDQRQLYGCQIHAKGRESADD